MSIIGTLPVTLTNGTTADATQVMTDLNFLVSQTNANAAALTGGNAFTGIQTINGTAIATTVDISSALLPYVQTANLISIASAAVGSGLVGYTDSITYGADTVGLNLGNIRKTVKTRVDTPVGHFGVGAAAVPESLGLVYSVLSRDQGVGITDIGSMVQFQRLYDVAYTGAANSLHKGLRSIMTTSASSSVTNVPSLWAVSGELTIGAGSVSGATGIGGGTAVSGVVLKNAIAYGVNAGTFQVVDSVVYATDGSTVTPSVAIEANLKVIGEDSTTANEGFGNRTTMAMFARGVNDTATFGNEVGSAIFIRHTNNSSDGGKGFYRNGIVITDQMTTTGIHSMDVGIRLDTAGRYGLWMIGAGHTSADIYLNAPSANGLICSGAYSTGNAIRVDDNYVAMDPTGAIRFRHETGKIQFYNAGVKCGYVDLSAADHAF